MATTKQKLTPEEKDKEKLIQMHNTALTAIENLFIASKQKFFDYAWRENVENFLTSESKCQSLIDWINQERRQNENIINIFNPAERQSDYTNATFKSYLTALQNFALLTDCYEIMINKNCTIEMRENIEYTICKFFNIHYSEFTKSYLQN